MWAELIILIFLVVFGGLGTSILILWSDRQKNFLKDFEEPKEAQQLLTQLIDMGWSKKTIERVFIKPYFQLPQDKRSGFIQDFLREASIFGSTSFYKLLRNESHFLTQDRAMFLLVNILNILEFPEEFDRSKLADLLHKIDLGCPPHHPFWRCFARLVDKAFPGQALSTKHTLNKQIHQLRYLISYQQALWVRQHYGKGKTDWQALVAYLRSLPRWSYRLRESARLHNKQLFGKKHQNTLPINIKILIGFHSEFILSNDGQFALILEGIPHVNGVVNGASFNYARANNKRHLQLDVAPVGTHDPVFRKKILRSKAGVYLSPTRFRRYQKGRNEVGWEQSYFNPRGSFSYEGHSRARGVTILSRQLSKDIKKDRK